MANYSLGEARGKVTIDYDGSWAQRAKSGIEGFKASTEGAMSSTKDMLTAVGGWKGIGTLATDTGKKLTIGLTAPAVAAGTALGALTIGPGLDRLISIDNAQAKLKGLGHDADSVQQIMDNALASVKGTAFGLGDAATVAANAVAAGVKPGQDLERTLRLTADAATIAGVDMSAMGSVFNKVAASNKVQMDSINQLHDAGVPALQLLANQMGVTAEEASKMASDGKIDFATFQDAMESGMGGAALASGETFEGAMANMRAAMGRFGAELLGEILPMVQEAFARIMDAFDKLKPLATQLGAAITPVLSAIVDGIVGLVQWFANLSPQMQTMIMSAIGIAAALGPVLLLVGKLITSVTAIVGAVKGAITVFKLFGAVLAANPIGLIVTAIAGLVAALVWFFTETELGREIVANVTQFIQEAWENVVAFLGPIFQTIGEIAVNVWNGVQAAIAAVVDWFQAYVWPIIQFVIDMIVAYFQMYWTVVSTVWNGIMAVVGAVVDWFMAHVWPTIQAVINFIVALFNFFAGVVQKVWQSIYNFIAPVVMTIVNAITTGFTAAWNFIQQVFNNVRNFIQTIWNAISTAIGTAVNAVWSVISGTWSAITGFVTGVFNNVKNAIMNPLKDALNFIGTIKDQVVGFFANAGSWLVDAGKNIIRGFLDGLNAMLGEIGNFFNDLTSMIPEIKGPPEKDKVLLTDNGKLIMQSLYNGLEDEMGSVERLLTGMNATIPATLNSEILANVGAGKPQQAGQSIVVNQTFTVTVSGSLAEAEKDVMAMLGHATELVREELG